jgi:hypothetical protein
MFFFILSPSTFIHLISKSQQLMCPIYFHCQLALLDLPNGSGDTASPCFRPFWIGKFSDTCLLMATLLCFI